MDGKIIGEIERRLHYVFRDKKLLEQAFTHSSYANQANVADNERMEFFGDAILEYVSSKYLYAHYPQCDAGELSVMRARVVSADGLRPVIDKLGVLRYLQVSDGADSVKKLSRKIEANLYEAILCAIYLDGGLDSAVEFALATLDESLANARSTDHKDSKTLLQEYCQKHKLSVEYRQVSRTGPDNDPNFTYELLIDGKAVSTGSGSGIKAAEQAAADKIVHEWRIE